MARRLQFILLGFLAGAAFWQLSELPWAWRETRGFIALAVLALAFFGSALGMLGEIGARCALMSAALIALPAAGLIWLKSFGFVDAEQLLASGHTAVALLVITVLPIPFAIARARGAGWCNYRVLFDESWSFVVRYAAAWLFVAVVWLVLWLLSSLLTLVGIDEVGDFLTWTPVLWMLSGAVTGLGLAVVTELSDMISPHLLLRLLRLLLPLVLVVEVVFVAVLPASGLVRLFGYISPTAILIATALASISLISIGADRDDPEAARSRALTLSMRGLALLLPVLAGFAVWALAIRVQANGWTPDRVAAATVLVVIAGYAVGYAAAVLRGKGWMARIRQTNIVMALAMVLLAALWLTPLFSAEVISVRSQIARFERGQLPVTELPLWEFSHDWGIAGARGLDTLRAEARRPGREALSQRLAQLSAATLPSDMSTPVPGALADRVAALRDLIHVLPEGTPLPDPLLLAIARTADDTWIEGCRAATPGKNPGCVLVIQDFIPGRPGRDALFLRHEGYDSVLAFHESGKLWISARTVMLGGGGTPEGGAVIDAITPGGADLVPAEIRALPVNGQQLIVLP